jgi:hypothetical protein
MFFKYNKNKSMSNLRKLRKSSTNEVKNELITNNYTNLENGKLSDTALTNISNTSNQIVEYAVNNQTRFEEISSNPKLANNKEEMLIVLQQREIIILYDKSGSMGSIDNDPTKDSTLNSNNNWTRWDSAKIAITAIMELALSFDKNNEIDIMAFPGSKKSNVFSFGKYSFNINKIKNISEIEKIFRDTYPSDTTPLGEALTYLRQNKLDALLKEKQPFTVIIMTDGTPDNQENVKEFFAKLIKDYKLNTEQNKHLAAFSFVQIGDDDNASQFLESLDDDMATYLKKKGINTPVDIIDTKKDNFIFGTDKFKNSNWKGPFALFWDAIFD